MHSITSLSRYTGIKQATLRTWERRYGFPRPVREPNGRRAYEQAEVERLLLVARLLHSGYAIRDLVDRTIQDLTALAAEPKRAAPTTAGEVLRDRLWQAVVDRDMDAFRRVAGEAMATMDAPVVADEVIAPVMRAIGDGWSDGSIPISLEHVASATIRQMLMSVGSAQSWARGGLVTAFTTWGGEQHELGALLAWYIAIATGSRAIYLGANLPTDECAAAARLTQAEILVISTIARSKGEDAAEALKVLARTAPPQTKIWVGTRPDDPLATSGDWPGRVTCFTSLLDYAAALRAQMAGVA